MANRLSPHRKANATLLVCAHTHAACFPYHVLEDHQVFLFIVFLILAAWLTRYYTQHRHSLFFMPAV